MLRRGVVSDPPAYVNAIEYANLDTAINWNGRGLKTAPLQNLTPPLLTFPFRRWTLG